MVLRVLQFGLRFTGTRTGQLCGHKNACEQVTQDPGPTGMASKASSLMNCIPIFKIYLQAQQDFMCIAKTVIL